jgi:hypothetical protein
MFYKTRHIGVVTTKFNDSCRIFKKIFGFNQITKKKLILGNYIENLVALKKVKLNMCHFKTKDKVIIELLEYRSPRSRKKKIKSNNVGVSHLAFSIKSFKLFKKKIKTENIKPLGKIQKSPDGKVLVAYFSMLDEILLEIVQELN